MARPVDCGEMENRVKSRSLNATAKVRRRVYKGIGSFKGWSFGLLGVSLEMTTVLTNADRVVLVVSCVVGAVSGVGMGFDESKPVIEKSVIVSVATDLHKTRSP